MNQISVDQLNEWIQESKEFQLIDVREPFEHQICNLQQALFIPMGQIPESIDQISRNIPVIIHCKSGRRSETIGNWLMQNHNFDNLYNLEGGILAWAAKIDTNLPQNY